MKIILLQTVPKVGKEGSVTNVADGYARNYLFPRKLAIVATKNQLEALEKKNARVAAKTAGEKAASEALREQLNGAVLRIPGQVGGNGKLFGAITSDQISNAIREQLKATVERRQIALHDPIKRLGQYVVELDLHREVDAKITVDVFDPNAPVPVVAAPAEPISHDDEE